MEELFLYGLRKVAGLLVTDIRSVMKLDQIVAIRKRDQWRARVHAQTFRLALTGDHGLNRALPMRQPGPEVI
jgi:hypothetical protein